MAKKKKGWVAEFREFALRGNVIDLAVGVIIGGAFSKITSSLVDDVFMPLIGALLGGVDFSSLNIKLGSLVSGRDPVELNLGNFVSTIFDFALVALCVFLFVKAINAFRRKEVAPPTPPSPTKEEILLTEIRDLLKTR